ncbi:MAG: mechanosensitive ion channel family protein [Woeseiaceae bacterium]
MTITKNVALLLICIAALVASQQAHSQQDQGLKPAAAGATVDALEVEIAAIESRIADYRRVQELAAASEPGLQGLLLRRLDNIGYSAIEQINSLAESVIEQHATGGIAPSYKDQTVVWLEVALQWINEGLTRNRADIATMLAQESSMTAAEAAASAVEIDDKLSNSVQSLKGIVRALDHLDELGVDVSERRRNVLDRLRDNAEMLAIAIEIDSENLKKLRYRFSLSPDDADLKILVKVADRKRDSYARNLGAISDMLKAQGDDASEYRSLVLMVTGDVASQILDTGVMSSLARQWSKTTWNWVSDNGLNMIFKIIMFVLIVVAFRALSLLMRRTVERAVSHGHMSVLLRSMIASTVGNFVMAIGIMIAFSQMGISLGPLLAGLGVLGFIIGFALQDTLGNFAAGMMILIYRPYDVGDVITAAGATGKVDKMSLVNTIILTFDNQKLIVPNKQIWGDVIQNVTAQQVRRVDMTFSISYADDVEKAEQVLADIIEQHNLTLDEPKPAVKLHTLNASSVDFVVRPWVNSEDYWAVYWDITREVKMRFDREGISIPFAQHDVHHYYDGVRATPSEAGPHTPST